MAIQNNPYLYAGGAVKLDSTPSLNFYSQLMARKQAKVDAMNQYYQKLMDETQGQENKMRPKDIEGGWGQKYNDWQLFYMNPDNKKAILNPSKYGFEKANQFDAMHQDLIADARKSKKALEDEKTVAQHALSGKWLPTDSDMNEVNSLSKTIYDPSRKISEKDQATGFQTDRDPDVAYLSVNVPDPTQTEKNQAMKYATGKIQMTPDKGTTDSKAGTITYKSAYTPDDVTRIATNYAHTVAGDKKFTNHYDRLMHDDIHYKAYNEVYHKYFGKDIESPEEMAAAEAALHAEGDHETKTMKWTDPEEKYRFEQQRQKDRMELMNASHGFQSWLKKQPTYGQLNKQNEDVLGANAVLHEVKSILFNPKNISYSAQGENVNLEELEVNDPTVLNQFKGIGALTNNSPNSMTYNIKKNKLNLIYKDTNGNEIDRQEIDPKTYLKLKIKQTYPGKDVGTLNNMVDKFYEDNGGNLYKALKALDQPQAPKAAPSKMVTVKLKDGRTGQIPEDKVPQFLKENQGSKRQ